MATNKANETWKEEDSEGDLLREQEAGRNKSSADEISDQVQQVQNQLLELKRKQDEVERQKRELEELSRKQREFDEGRREILERLTRGLVVIERQEYEVKREAEQLELIRENFGEQLSQVEAIKPDDWGTRELPAELTRALAVIDQANAVYNQARVRLEALREETATPGADVEDDAAEGPAGARGFWGQVKDGFAFSLPLMVFAVILLFIILARS